MKKLLHLQLLPLLSGVQNFSLHLLMGLDKSEYDIHVACLPDGPLVQEVISRGYKYHPLCFLKHAISCLDILAFWQIYRLCKKEGFDIVHTNSSKPGLLGRIAARMAGVPLIIHSSHGLPFQANQPKYVQALFMVLEWLGNRFCDKVAFVNHSDRILCIDKGLIQAAKAVTIYNALPPTLETILRQIPIRSPKAENESLLIGCTLRFSTQKNIVNIIIAACKACKLEPRLRFVFIGEGEHYALCRSIVASKSLNDRILLPGWDNDVTLWLARMDVFMLYSRWEALPFSIIEANFSALPVIGSRIPSIMELVDEDTGWLVELDDENALINTLVSLPALDEKILEKGKKARKRIAELCSYQAMLEAYTALYRGM